MPTTEASRITGLDLKVARVRSGLRQYDVASKVGIAPNRLSEIENGRRQISTELFQHILEVISRGQDVNMPGNGNRNEQAESL